MIVFVFYAIFTCTTRYTASDAQSFLRLIPKPQTIKRGSVGGIPVSLVVDHPAERPDLQDIAGAPAPVEDEYRFLLGRYVDAVTLARASTLAAKWGVHPHDVLIANGWLTADDYYRALAEACGAPFKPVLAPTEVVPPGAVTPRQCLASGLLKERARRRHYVLAPERLRPNAVRALLVQLSPYGFTLGTPRAVRDAITRHFAPSLAQVAVEALAIRRPEQSARTRTVPWQRTALIALGVSLIGVLPLAPVDIIHAVTLLLAMLFVPVIGLRAAAAYDCAETRALSRRAMPAFRMRRFPPTPFSCRSIARRTCCPRSFRRCRGSTGRPPSWISN